MDSDFDNVLDDLRDTVPPKAQHVLASVLFGIIVQDMKVDFDMTTDKKPFFGCLEATHAQDFLLDISASTG
jgi:hypothetical protein